nr:transglutaminase domain-containing protein [uncultured Psychroserpens sp.]
MKLFSYEKTSYASLSMCVYFSIQAQNYTSVDAIVSNYPNKFKSIEEFANTVEIDFDSDINKVRAVYYWIANHITYDYKSLKKNNNGFEFINSNPDDDYETRLSDMQKRYAEGALKRKQAVCEGYSQLMKFVLNELDIETEVVHGFAKISPSEIGYIRHNTNHAWNAVKLNNQWHLIDATWSTGSEEKQPNIFNFTDTYFLISPKHLILSHFPKEQHWQLLDQPISKANYFFKPIFYEAYFNSGLKLNPKTNGIIKVKRGGKIKIIFDEIDSTKTYYYAFKGQSISKPLTIEKKSGQFIAKIPFNAKRKTEVGIYDDTQGVIEFKVVIDR